MAVTAILVDLPQGVRSSIVVGPAEEMTDKAITDTAALVHDLEDICARGYSVSRDETYSGVYGTGALIFGPGNVFVAGIAIAAPKNWMESAIMLSHAQKVIAVAAELSMQLGASQIAV